MNKSFYSYDGEIRIYIRKNKRFDTIQLIRAGKKITAKERKKATTENIEYYKQEGLKAWNRLHAPIPKIPTFKEFTPNALKLINATVTEATITDRKSRLERFIFPYFGNIRLDKITPLIIENWQTDIVRLRGHDMTRRNKQLLTSILNRAVIHGYIKENPTNSTTIIKGGRKEEREVYTKKEVELMIKEGNSFISFFVQVMVSLGLRSGEMIGIKFSDINFKQGTLRVQRSIRFGVISKPKSGICRDVEIPHELLIKLYERKKVSKSDWIFTNSKGSYFGDCSHVTRRHFKPLLERLGIRYKTIYSLRHTYATLSLQGGQTIAYISKQLGHKEISTTFQYYVKYLKDNESITKANDIFSFNQPI